MTRKRSDKKEVKQLGFNQAAISTALAKRDEWVNSWDSRIATTIKSTSSSILDTRDLHVISVDVSRSVAHWDIHRHISISKRVLTRKNLKELILNLGSSTTQFRYYQGLHEVSLVVLELCSGNPSRALPLLQKIINAKFLHFLRQDFNLCLLPMLQAVEFLVSETNPELGNAIFQAGGQYHFAIPWILTWFSHSLESFADICFMFDFLIDSSRANDNTLIIYACAAIVLLDAKRILEHRNDSCHVLKCTQTSVKCVSLTEATKLAMTLRQKFDTTMLPERIPGIKFLLEGCRPLASKYNAIGSFALVTFLAASTWAIAMEFFNERTNIL